MFCDPPKNALMSGVKSWKWPTIETVTVLPRPSGHPVTEHVSVTSAGLIVTPEFCASSWIRHRTTLYVGLLASRSHASPDLYPFGVSAAWNAPSRAAFVTE